MAAGLATGALAIAVASPTDLVKVRMQASTGGKPRYASAMSAYGTIVRTEGLGALWTGLGPNVARNAIINAAELASNDAIKQAMLEAGAPDGVPVHLGAGLGAGFCAVVCGSPVDVVKSRMMGKEESGGPPPATAARGAGSRSRPAGGDSLPVPCRPARRGRESTRRIVAAARGLLAPAAAG